MYKLFSGYPQVTCEYYFDQGACVPVRVHSVVVSTQHSEKIGLDQLREEVMTKVIKEVIPAKYLDAETRYHINPCGDFIIGGPMVSFIQRTPQSDRQSLLNSMSHVLFVLVWNREMLDSLDER